MTNAAYDPSEGPYRAVSAMARSTPMTASATTRIGQPQRRSVDGGSPGKGYFSFDIMRDYFARALGPIGPQPVPIDALLPIQSGDAEICRAHGSSRT